jgi:hypothetical protein
MEALNQMSCREAVAEGLIKGKLIMFIVETRPREREREVLLQFQQKFLNIPT